ncbi:spore coat associated protein CotJA [Clostridium kluyveri]|uniref:spore coat associated protein CotJA n=1 Tax=Clostridium TaxID=1485 RepID=UPI001FA88F5D|nr:spore coat associated protein CotJA [Clostridium kluyveri]UZQ51937.1 spore coat associated protein CotJA [Clostridium kluyveri]
MKILYSRFIPYVNPQFMRNSNLPPSSGRRLARAYVPMQPYIGLLPLNIALKKGTIFPNLVMPYPENEDCVGGK